MYGPVSATSRSVGVRQAPLGTLASGNVSSDRKTLRVSSVGSSLQTLPRRNALVRSLVRPSRAPQGRQFLAGLAATGEPSAAVVAGAPTQSHTPPAGQSAS